MAAESAVGDAGDAAQQVPAPPRDERVAAPWPGDALFVAGYDAAAETSDDDPRLPLFTRLASVLLASSSAWRLRRLAPHGGDRDAPSRGNVRRELDALLGRAAAQRLIVIAAPLTRTVEGLALVCAPELGGFREDASVPLEWIGLRLRRAEVVPTALLLITTGAAADARAALDALGVGHAAHVVAVDVDAPAAALTALIDAIEQAAIDPATAAVTPRSLAATLGARQTAAVHPATGAQVLVSRRGGGDAGAAADVELPGGFRLGAELGRGRFGVVYRARQALTGREVAIKLLEPRSLADAQAFIAEVQALARVEHPGVVRVLHADTTGDGRPFLAMELVTGATLTATIGDGPLTPGLAWDLGRQLVGALAAAHAAGVVHGDVSPDNVLVAAGPPARAVLIDFGMARLHGAGAAAGGTRGYLAPEVIAGAPLTPRTDVFAAAMVLVRMLAGPAALVDHRAALATLPPGAQRAGLTRALDPEPAARFADAGALAAALGVDRVVTAPVRPPFRMAAPFGEDDRGDFHGRDAEIERLLEQVLFRTAVAYVAPSGTGKTSLLRAGLIPRLRALDVEVVYVACRGGVEVDVAALLGAPGRALPDVLAERVAATPRRLVLLIDQVEAALTDAHDASRGAAVLERLDLPRWPRDAPVAVVWSVREEYLARLLDRAQRLAPGLPLVRLGPLPPAIARAVFEQTLAARQVAIAPALLDVLIADLTAAAAGLAAELGWGDAPAVYPPHLQLAGSVLYDARGDGPLDRALYERLGGLPTILREHLRHVLEDELSPTDVAIARELLQALVTTGHMRAACAEDELVVRVAAAVERPAAAIVATLHYLRERGVVVATAGGDGEPLWDLAHDSLVARVEAWIDTSDLARRRALELVRHHLRRARTAASGRLSADELREVSPHLTARDLAALDDEWRGRPGAPPRAATTLVAASRQAVRRRRGALALAALVALGAMAALALRWQSERDLRRRQLAVRDRDLGQSLLVVRAFDWDPATLTATDTTAARFTWTLVRPDPADDTRPGEPFASYDLRRQPQPPPVGAIGAELVTARGGPAVLVIDRVDRAGRRCTQVAVPIRRLPGYRAGAAPAPLDIRVPTCEGTRAGMIEVEAGPFIAGGVGEPPSEVARDKGQPEGRVVLAAYALDRTEMPNAFAEAMGASLVAAGYAPPLYPDTDQLYQGSEPPWPITAIARRDAAMLCAMAGKRLPSSLEWQKAVRGGDTIAGRPNPHPRRNLPWGPPRAPAPANLKPPEEGDRLSFGAPIPTGGTSGDVGPYGHVDLAGNVSEWTTDDDPRGMAIVRGGNWAETEPDWLVDFMAIDNPRAPNTTMYHIGFRCAGRAGP